MQSNTSARHGICVFVLMLAAMNYGSSSDGQLQITEVLSDSLSAEPKWEWIEVRNTGGLPLNLHGYVFDDDDGLILGGPNISDINGPTSVPAGGVAVLYNGTSFGFDPQLFRNAWQISASVPMIAVTSAPGLNNGGDHIGLWSSYANYLNDAVDNGMGGLVVGSFNSSAANFDYGSFTNGPPGVSGYWNGMGDYRDGSNWQTSVSGVAGAVTSIEVTSLSPTNNVNDVANPGIVPAGPRAVGLLISEIMYNPQSAEPAWEWVEVVNNTGSELNFGTNNHYIDDAVGTLAGPNITSGIIPQGGIAVLFNSSLPANDFATAWGAGVNAIPVSSWPPLNNSGDDVVAIWNDATAYATDRTNMTYTGAVSYVPYNADAIGWPFDDGNGSVYLTDLVANPTDGANWLLSFPGDGISVNASPVVGVVIEHNGGDIGSPGFFFTGGPVITPDFNNDGMINGADIDLLTMDIANMVNNVAMFDLNGDGTVNFNDVTQWLADAGAANLPSMNPYLIGDANLDGTVDGQDFIAWNNNKFTSTGRWTQADFDANGVTDGQDFIQWNGNKFMSSDSMAAVPEPGFALTSWLLTIGVATIARRRQHLQSPC